MVRKRSALAGVVMVVLMLMLMLGTAYAGSPLGSDPMDEAWDAMDGGAGYTVTSTYVWQWASSYYVFEPADVTATTGLIVYPGANIDVRSYAVMAAEVARQGYLVALVPMPLDLALLGYNRANKPIDQLDGIDTWAISGHSLGGVMACNYARNHQSDIDAVVLLASYPSATYRLDSTSLDVLSIYGTCDGLTTLEDIDESVAHLPVDAQFCEIAGANHSQFGYYTPDTSGDLAATISRASQTAQICAAATAFLAGL